MSLVRSFSLHFLTLVLLLSASPIAANHITITECRATKAKGIKYANLSWNSTGQPVQIRLGFSFRNLGTFPADSSTIINLGKGGAGGQAGKRETIRVCEPGVINHCDTCELYIGGKLPKP